MECNRVERRKGTDAIMCQRKKSTNEMRNAQNNLNWWTHRLLWNIFQFTLQSSLVENPVEEVFHVRQFHFIAYSVFRVHLSKYLQCENFPYTSRTQNICTIFAYPCESLASVMYKIAFSAKNSMRMGRGVGAWAFKSQDLWNCGRDGACSVQLVSVLFARGLWRKLLSHGR